jgi:uncharacterized protein
MARERPFDIRRLDVAAFAADGAFLEGQVGQAALQRLSDSVLPVGDEPAPPVMWSLQGLQRPVKGGEPEVWLHLEAETHVHLQCQRCLQSVNENLMVDRAFRFVATDDEADRLDEESEDDVLVLSRSLDVLELLEDELILALPLVPRHEVCPESLPMVVGEEDLVAPEVKPNPFAALAALRKPDAGGPPEGGEGGENGSGGRR